MSRSKLSILVRSLTLLASVGAPSLALAADLLPPPPPPPYETPVDFGGGWYLRGDVGASVYDRPHYAAADSSDYTFFGNDAGGGAFAGAGVGYQFNDFFRADVTGEYRFSTGLRTNSYNNVSYNYDCGGGYDSQRGSFTCNQAGGGTNYDSIGGHYSAAVVLANAYVDLGHWYGFTPFIGGGVGAAFNKLSGFSDSSYANTTFEKVTSYDGYGDCQCGNPSYTYKNGAQTFTSGGTFKDKTTTSFAWALHAGVAYDVTDRFKVEVAYRYLNLGHASTGILNCFCGETQKGLKVKDLEAHDVKIGLRYLLGGGAAIPLPPLAPAYEPAPGPLVRKY